MIPGVNALPQKYYSTTCGNWRNKFFNERKGKYQTENKVIEKEKLQEQAKKEMLDMIHSGKIRIDINPENKIDIVKIIDFLKKVNRKPLKIIICFQATLLYLIEN